MSFSITLSGFTTHATTVADLPLDQQVALEQIAHRLVDVLQAGVIGVSAVTVEGLSFERRLQLAGSELLLNGTGIRGIAWFKGFVAALYLGKPASTAAQVTAQAGPKRLQLRLLVDVPADEFAKAFRKGLTRNLPSPADAAGMEARMVAFEGTVHALAKVHKGDVIDLDLDPVKGTLFSLNGTLRGSPLAGDDFYSALLRAFIGDQPYDEKLKAGLLAGRT